MKRLMMIAVAAALTFAGAPAFAVGSVSETLALDPDYRDAVRFINEKRYPEAIEKLTKVRALYPPAPEVFNWLGYAHRKLKDYPQSKLFYDEALRLDPEFLPALEYQGEWYIENNDLASAEANLAKLEKLCGRCHEWQDLAESLTKAGRPPKS